MSVFGYVLILIGGFSVMGCLFYPHKFLQLLALPIIVERLGKQGARAFYLLASLLILGLGFLLALNIRL